MNERINTYLLDAESPVEVARLIEQDDFMRHATGLFPSESLLANARDVLDVACGPGGWPLDAARNFPSLQVTGIDSSPHMIQQANSQARTLRLKNVSFLIANALESLPFASRSFDVVDLRFATAWIPRDQYNRILSECLRVLRPGGWFIWSEGESGTTTSPATARGQLWLRQAMSLQGLGFGDGTTGTGVTSRMRILLEGNGFTSVKLHASVGENSYGTPYHSNMSRNFTVILKQLVPLAQFLGVTEEKFMETIIDIEQEMQQEDYSDLLYILTAVAQKPA